MPSQYWPVEHVVVVVDGFIAQAVPVQYWPLGQVVVVVVVVVEHFTVPQVEQDPPSYQQPVPGEGQETQDVVEPPQSIGQLALVSPVSQV